MKFNLKAGVAGFILLALIAGFLFAGGKSGKSAPIAASPASPVVSKPVVAAWHPKALPTPQLNKLKDAKAPAQDFKAYGESLREYAGLRAKVLRTTDEDRAYTDALRSTAFLTTSQEFLSQAPTAKTEAAAMQATQVLIDALKNDANGFAKEIVYQLLTDGHMDNKTFSPVQRQLAARDRAELMFHYLALHPEERASLKGDMTKPNSRTVFAAVQSEHMRNVASSQTDTLGKRAR